MSIETETQAETTPQRLSNTVIALGFVSLFMDISTEMAYTQIPRFLTLVLGVPASIVGLIEGLAESVASLFRLVSGYLSDRSGRRKPLTVLGYGSSALAKPLMASVTLWPVALLLRLIDRLGKGIRTAPRDALIAEATPMALRGRAFGLHRAMDTIGAVIGPLLGILILNAIRGNLSHQLRTIFLLAGIPGLLAVLTLLLFVHEKPSSTYQKPATALSLPKWSELSPLYRRFLVIVFLFNLGNFSDAFLLLRAQDIGYSATGVMALYALFNVVEALLDYNIGILGDRIGRRPLVIAGYLVFAVVYLGIGLAPSKAILAVFFVVYGLYYALTQGVQRAFTADFSDPDKLATQIGAYHMVVGIALLPASLIAGALYQYRAFLPFVLGASLACLSALLLANLPSPNTNGG
ncbi:Major Facilitator Superfamily transporter [Chthonomonas calidirosea]|uniref:MFS transporter n=1 Tax=Chthonomonas calidirosea TaxID=454171 RepID=UPI0006DD43DA|nr:MFS transporter [Chthonomonas calidirosea]CEK17945.1 Major Facilitator Superfamily transporter [Chthonomonas calidirosea]